MLKNWLKKCFMNQRKSQRGNVAVTFAMASVALVGVGGGAIDYASTNSTTAHLQAVTDAAVLVAVNELKLSGSKTTQASTIRNVAINYIKRNLNKPLTNPMIVVKVSAKLGTVDLSVSGGVETKFLGMLGLAQKHTISTNARGRILGGLPLCVLSLDETIGQALTATNTAKLTAANCSVHANSTDTNAIEVWGSALFKTGLTCSAGGASGGTGNFIPAAIQDCPAVPDPLASRVGLTVGSVCDHTNAKYTNGSHVLTPGRYCQGLKISGNANVEFSPGIYIIDGGKFEITGNSTAEGEYVGFYFTGPNAFFGFHGRSTVNLTAPKDGDMAGLLFFENPNRANSYVHEITSFNTEKLVGTVYLPKSELSIKINGKGSGDVAQESAFTVVVAKKITLAGKSNLVLNTNFNATDVPVPESIKNLSGRVVISK